MSNQFRYFEDYQAGQKGIAVRPVFTRTVTEADIANFAWITADYSRAHLDRHFMANSVYGCRIAHGLLGSSLAIGLLSLNSPHIVGRGVPGAYFYGFEANYRDAIKMGDTISIHWQVAEKVNDPTHEGFGQVKTAFQLVNQEGTPVYDGTVTTLVRKESAKEAELQLKPGIPWSAPEFEPDPEQVYYAEDFPVGKGGETEGRTITETDIVNFAGLTGDYDPQYVDAEFARRSMFGERIAHGMLVFTCAQGAWTQYFNKPLLPETRFGGHLFDRATFLYPVKIGDTIRCRHKITATRVSESKPEAGLVTIDFQVVNQRNEVVQEGVAIQMLAARAGLHMQSTV